MLQTKSRFEVTSTSPLGAKYQGHAFEAASQFLFYYQPERAERANGWCFTFGTKIALRFPCVFVCLSVCVSALITCVIYYVIRDYATAVYSSFWRFAGQTTAK